MTLDLSVYEVSHLETSDHAKFNAMLQAVEDYVNALIPVALVDAKGDLIVGSAANTAIRLAVGTSGQVLTADSGETAGVKWDDATGGGGSGSSLVTTLPGSPAAGDEIIYTNSTSAPTYYWHLKYNGTTGKWLYIGGIPLFNEVTTSGTTSSTSYAALTNAGPVITLPLAGDYFIATGATFDNDDNNAPTVNAMSYDIGAAPAVDADAIFLQESILELTTVSRERLKTGLSAITLTAKYKQGDGTGGTSAWQDRWMRVTPKQVG